ncbi:YitT family protein [uncultured Negativibacillus sp.]|uniref:YitT family protein n=1 Tax=uncultured Negativibacillus sp. TaxID=1980696 RepID=UPI0025E1CC37|nr:YitT family protein [uncultured Negativibacillus sp.]
MDKTNTVADKGALVKEYAIITAGIFLTAAAVYFFMMPANIVLGSITGLAIVLVNFIPVQVSVMTFILNVFCLVIGFLLVGKEFGAKTVYTSILLPVFLYVLELLFPNNSSLTNDLLLDTLCCIILISIGQTLMFNANASSGGLDIVAKILNKYFHLELGKGIALAGILTVATTILVYDAKTLIVGILGTYFNGLVLDEYISGFARRKRVCFLSEKYQEIAEYIMHDIKRGVTLYEAKGGYDQSKKVEVQTILTQNEYGQLIDYIHKTDPMAFVTVSTVSEVVGYWNKAR